MTQFIINYHNEHNNSPNPSEGVFYGPFTKAKAKAILKTMADEHDELFDVDSSGLYAGYDFEKLVEAKRDEDLESEIWAEIVELKTEIPWVSR